MAASPQSSTITSPETAHSPKAFGILLGVPFGSTTVYPLTYHSTTRYQSLMNSSRVTPGGPGASGTAFYTPPPPPQAPGASQEYEAYQGGLQLRAPHAAVDHRQQLPSSNVGSFVLPRHDDDAQDIDPPDSQHWRNTRGSSSYVVDRDQCSTQQALSERPIAQMPNSTTQLRPQARGCTTSSQGRRHFHSIVLAMFLTFVAGRKWFHLRSSNDPTKCTSNLEQRVFPRRFGQGQAQSQFSTDHLQSKYPSSLSRIPLTPRT